MEILYEDENVVAINKPAGLIVHADGKTSEPTVVDWILETYPEIKKHELEIGEPLKLSSGIVIARPGIVHRIDRETSGVLIIAKNHEAFLHLKSQFQNRETEKKYNVFVYGVIDEDEGLIDRPIGKSKSDFRQWSAQHGARGEMRVALTEYKVLKRSSNKEEKKNKDQGFSYLEVMPKTGRTHQIRVHFKAINHPIVADKLYAPKREMALDFERLALHARSITFTKLDGEKVTIEAALPEDFVKALAYFPS